MSEFERISGIVEPIAVKYGIDKVSLFGSRAKGQEKADSDYDFLISKGKMNSLLLYVAFVNDLEEAFEKHVDVVTDTSEDESFVKKIKKDSVLLYECKG